jgi:hypothetical protein
MDAHLRQRLESFLLPLYQDLDGVSRFDTVERVERIARRLYAKSDRAFELLLLFHGLGKWLAKMGNLSRTMLAVGGLSEEELRVTASAIQRLDAPATEAERAVAAAILIDNAGVRGLAERFARSRREGQSVADVVRAALGEAENPQWLGAEARRLLDDRRETRRLFCRAILGEFHF